MTDEQRQIMEKAAKELASFGLAGLRAGFVLGILQLALPRMDPDDMRGLAVDLRRACSRYLQGGGLTV